MQTKESKNEWCATVLEPRRYGDEPTHLQSQDAFTMPIPHHTPVLLGLMPLLVVSVRVAPCCTPIVQGVGILWTPGLLNAPTPFRLGRTRRQSHRVYLPFNYYIQIFHSETLVLGSRSLCLGLSRRHGASKTSAVGELIVNPAGEDVWCITLVHKYIDT